MLSIRLYISVGLLIAVCLCCWSMSRNVLVRSSETPHANLAVRTEDSGNDLVPAPMPDWFKFQSNDTVNGWINNLDNKAITGHAWEVWGAITTLTDQQHNGNKLPVYETWWSVQEALAPPGPARAAILRNRKVIQL